MNKALIINNTSHEGHHGCDLVMRNLRILCEINNIRIVAAIPTGAKIAALTDMADSLGDIDCVIVNGEGTLHHSQQRALDLMDLVEHAKKIYQVPAFLINSTYQSNSGNISNRMRLFDMVYVRESRSKMELDRIGVKSAVVPDITFYSEFTDAKGSGLRGPAGVTDNVSREKSEILYKFAKSNNLIYVPALRHPKYIEFNQPRIFRYIKYTLTKYCIKFLSSFKTPMSELYARMMCFSCSYEEYIDIIAQLSILLAGRYHSLCFALKARTPFLAISSNTHKIEGMLEDIGIGSSRIVCADGLSPKLLQKFSHFTEDELINIEKYVKNARQKNIEMFKEINMHLEVAKR